MQETSNTKQTRRGDSLFIATCVIYLAILSCFVLLRMAGGLGLFGVFPGWLSDVMFSFLSQILLMTLFPIVGMIIYRKKFCKPQSTSMSFSEFVRSQDTQSTQNQSDTKAIFSSWWFKKPSPNIIAWSILLGFLCFFFNVFVSSFFNGILAGLGHRGALGGAGGPSAFTGISGLFVVLVLTAVLPGFCEEVTHRGLLMRGFANRLGILRAISLSSILFGLMHLNIVQFFFATILGYLMAMAMMSARNIWTPIIIHFMNNAFAVYLTFASANGWFLGDFFSQMGNFFNNTFFFIYIAAFFGLYFAIVAIIHKLARDNFIRDNAKLEQPRPFHPRRNMQAVKYYISAGEDKKRPPLEPLERTLIYGIVFLGTVITVMTLVWGFL